MNRIVLGVTGSIAAYKALSLVRLWVKAGKEVRVIMTPAACEFVSPLSFATLSKNPVFTEIIDSNTWNNHVDVGIWADAFVVAPATATTLSKMASGQSDNMLVATYLSAKCPVFFAPAMDLDMWEHPATRANIQKLVSYGNQMIPVGYGELASGLVGDGRMAEPHEIVTYLEQFSKKKLDLKGKKVLITAGPTQESIDPVRFLSNHSSGRMGIEIANEFCERGASVDLILGPSNLRPNHPEIRTTHVQTAQDMYEACSSLFNTCDIAIFAAAVADYRPIKKSEKKVKKKEGNMEIELIRTIDIAATFGKQKRKDQLAVGFALESNDEMKNAQAKLDKKNFDFIVLNSLREKGAGFQHATNKVTIFQRDVAPKSYELKTKREVAADIANTVVSILSKNKA